jgi:hypothetical protein
MKFRRSNTTKTAFLLTALLGLGVTQVQPLLADELANVSDFKDCRAIKGEAERLLCYDTIADGGVFNKQKLEQLQHETFGVKEKAPDISIDQLSVTIVKVQKGATGIRYFHTADGQVWKQQESGHYTSKVPFEADIKSGTMGSFFLVNEGRRTIRVKRVK